jgi:hypothetical protein
MNGRDAGTEEEVRKLKVRASNGWGWGSVDFYFLDPSLFSFFFIFYLLIIIYLFLIKQNETVRFKSTIHCFTLFIIVQLQVCFHW